MDTTIDDSLHVRLLHAAQELVSRYTGWDFEPKRVTYRFNAPQPRPSVGAYGSYYTAPPQSLRPERELRLTEPLLTLESGFNGDETALDLATLLYLDPNIYPRYALAFTKGADLTWLPDDEGNYEQVIPLTGLWGYHENWDEAFIDSLDTLQDASLDDTTTTLSVTDLAGVNAYGEENRFQVGQILKLEDVDGYEYVYVRAVTVGTDPDPDTLTVTRGYRGTVARAWATETPLLVYRPMEGVVQATLELARLLYRRRSLDAGDMKQILGTNIKIVPETMPDYIAALLPGPRSWL